MTGVLVVAKPAGVTSSDVVVLVRRALHVRRVGHAGTLDPDATGVLPLLVGEATKLMPYLVDQDKEYRVTARFGVTTDTLDMGGRVLATSPVTGLTRAALERAAATLVGRIRQVPPMYSALHHEGRRLYDLARRGVEVAREPRDVVVHAISIDQVGDTSATLTVTCGKGTYVRVLVADLGDALGCGGAVADLVRTRVGPFSLADAVPLDEIRGSRPERLASRLVPPEAALAGWTAVTLGDVDALAFAHGQSVPVSRPGGRAGLVRVHAPCGALLGIGDLVGEGSRVRPVRVLHVDRAGTRVLPA